LIRTTYYNHPKHGALIVDTICRNPELFESFLTELRGISNGTISMRTALRQELEALKTLGHWNHITDYIGVFGFTGLTIAQSKRMVDQWHVYLLPSGRISMAGINT
jgi:aspartate aminotransferase, cytoplasmic